MQTTASPQPVVRRRRIWLWLLGIAAGCFLITAIAVASVFTLNRDAAALRREAFAALEMRATPRVQFSAGPVLMTLLRTGIGLIDKVPGDARLALDAVRAASVGVYRIEHPIPAGRRAKLLAAADARMHRRGWTRVVGVLDGQETVMIYVPEDAASGGMQRICLLVCQRDEIVVVAATAKIDALLHLAAEHGALAKL